MKLIPPAIFTGILNIRHYFLNNKRPFRYSIFIVEFKEYPTSFSLS